MGGVSSDGPFVTVYRGLHGTTVDMVESMLASEGLEPRRLGRSQAALVGVGMYAVEQLIEVPKAHAERATTLIAALEQQASDVDEAQLEQAALAASMPEDASEAGAARSLIPFLMLMLAIAALAVMGGLLGRDDEAPADPAETCATPDCVQLR
jgi:hypothetical protein